MAQDSANIPQADNLRDVMKTVVAVSQGKTSFQAIANAIGKVERQGRYYRLAAQILGLIENSQNNATLLPAGYELLRLLDTEGMESQQVTGFLRQRALAVPVIRAAFEFIQQHPNVTRSDLEEMLGKEFGLTKKSMSGRRVPSLISWLKQLNLISGSRDFRAIDGYVSTSSLGSSTESDLAAEDVDEWNGEAELEFRPSAPTLRELKDIWSGERKAATATTEEAMIAIKRLVEEAEEEKAQDDAASVRHQVLVERMATQLRGRGVVPQYNGYIDLYADIGQGAYLCEMKSCTEDNLIIQARRGLAQLYEYRYLHQLDNVKLVLVLEEQPLGLNRWYIDYLIDDRGILVCWALPGAGFECPTSCIRDLRELLG